MKTTLLILCLATAPTFGLACSPSRGATPDPIQRGEGCSFIQPQRIGASFADAAKDLGEGRVMQVFGERNGCDLFSSALIMQCSSGERLVIHPSGDIAEGNGGGVLIDVAKIFQPHGSLNPATVTTALAADATRSGHDVIWVDAPNDMPSVFPDWSDVTCACSLFYPGSKGSE